LENRKFMKIAKVLAVFAFFFVLILSIFIFNPKTEAYDNKITHPLLTEKIAELYNYIYEPDLTQKEIDLLMQGSTDEDTPPRWINHFYDPTTELGWSGKRLGDISQETVMTAAILVFGKEPVSVLNWVQNQELQNNQYSLYQGNRTFDSAVLYYLEGKKQEAYYSLGYVLHLIEDMAVPAHTRQDTHFDMAPEIFEQILDVKFDKGEPYEKWAEENGDIVPTLMDDLKKNYQPICNSLESCLIYLANYSNNNFFSQDSILDKEYAKPTVIRYVIINDKKYAYGENDQLLFVSENNPYRENSDIKIDNENYWNRLSPAAILAGVEVVKYFHEQAEKAKNNEIIIERPEKISFWKKVQTISTYGELARLWKLASFASMNPFSLWDDNSQQEDDQVKSQPPNILTDLGITYGEAQERMDDLQELLDLLNNREGGDNFSLSQFELPSLPQLELPSFELPSIEPPSLPSIEPPALEPPILGLPTLDMPPLLENPAQDQIPVQLTSNPAISSTSGGGGGSVIRPTYLKILITEIQILPLEKRFIELYNPNAAEVNLTGWYIQRKTKTGNSWDSFISSAQFNEKIIPPNGYFLIARSSTFNPDILLDSLTLSEDNVILLKNPNRDEVDKVGWGQTQNYEHLPTINPATGKSIGRIWDGTNQIHQDTDNNSIDFEKQSPTPKAQNISPTASPPSEPTPSEPEQEPESEPEPEPELPTDTVAPTTVFNLLSNQEDASFSINFEITDLSVENVSPSGLAVFQFRWQEKGGEWQEDVIQDIIDTPATYSGTRDFTGQDEKTYYFQVKAKDINNNESDWLPETPATTWIRTPKMILINEIQIDSIAGTGGADDDWVELYNSYDVGVSLSGWSIQRHTKSDPCVVDPDKINKKNFSNNEKGIFTIPAKGFFLIVSTKAKEELKDMADMTVGFSLTLDNTIYLVKNEDKIESGDDIDIIDKVGFGGQACFPEGNSAPSLSDPPNGGKSISRKKLGQDTNDNSADFAISDKTTPKTNIAIWDATEYSTCGSNSNPGTSYYDLRIRWQSSSQDISFYQVQYKRNNEEWQDWFSQPTQTEQTLRAINSLFNDEVYYFKARVQDLGGNMSGWSQIEVDLRNSVVINEVALFGTDADNQDQWIELYNKSDRDIDLTGWRIVSGSGYYDSLNLELQGTIPSKGYLVFEKNDDQTISDVTTNQILPNAIEINGRLNLVNEKSRLIDNFYSPGWLGWSEDDFVKNGNHYSMERISPYAFGSYKSNWKLNNGITINGADREENQIYGTPGQQNSNYQLYTPVATDFVENTVLPKSVDGVTESPYFFQGFVYVFKNKTLTIEPGVIIKFEPACSGLVIEGTLKVIGTTDEPIIFTSSSENHESNPWNFWAGIQFEKTSTDSTLENVIVNYAGNVCGEGFRAGIKVDQSSISLRNSTIERNLNNGLLLINSPSIIDTDQILDNKTSSYPWPPDEGKGITINGGSPTITNSNFERNHYGIYIGSWYDGDREVWVPAVPYIDAANTFTDNDFDIWPEPPPIP